MVGSKGAAVFYGDVNLPPNNEQAQIWLQVYLRENFIKIFGGAIQLSGNNVPISLISNSKFVNNFGQSGAAVSLNRGGGLYVVDSQFLLENNAVANSQNLADNPGIDNE